MLKRVLFAAVTMVGFCCASSATAGLAMYGGLGGHGPGSDSTDDGALVRIDQTTGDVSVIGHPTGVARLTGIAFDPGGALYGSTLGAIPFPPPPQPSTSDLIRINPGTGALISTIGPITDGAGGPAISIADLAAQPGTGRLFGVRAPVGGETGLGDVYTIDKSTGVASLVGSTGHFFDSIAFAPDGTLYATAADLGPMGAEINPVLLKVDPADGHVLSSVATKGFYGALGVRPSDGTIFAGNGDGAQIFTLDPATGEATALPHTTGTHFVGDIDFATSRPAAVPLPPAMWTGSATLLALLVVLAARGANVERKRAR
jgi:sugar lactone lactonase YvrE